MGTIEIARRGIVGHARRARLGGLVALTLGVLLVESCQPQPAPRVDDRAGVLDTAELPHLEQYLADVERESGVDIRFEFVDSLHGETLEQFAVRTARALGIGRHLDRHGLLFAYDVTDQRLRIEVGPTLQGVFTDRFVGYLMRDHVRSFFSAGNPTLGLRLTLFMLHARLRRAALGDEYDPRAAQFIEDSRRLATGGGASAGMADTGAPGFRNRMASDEARRHFTPQPTVAAAYQRYLEWLVRGQAETNVGLFTPATQGFLSRLPLSRAYIDYILFMEYGLAYAILERGDLAMLYFTDDPLVSPHFFRHTADGWQMDLVAEVRHSHEYVGGAWTWSIVERDDEITRAFADRFIHVGGLIRIAGGDNRPIPLHATEVSQ